MILNLVLIVTAAVEPDYFNLASDFIQKTGQHIFLTGKAGTGKTTLLKHIREHCSKQMVIVAPTGVAAINAGGVTMHSFFQLPFGSFVPGSLRGKLFPRSAVTDRHHLIGNLRFSNEKKELIRNLDLVIIDEVSMLRCDLLDAVDAVLQHVRQSREPFGGVQMLYIGDLYQLPPVVKDDEREFLKEYYSSPFFFEAHALKNAKPVCIELKKIYRQTDAYFINLLNRIRNNEVDEEDFAALRKLYKPGFRPAADDHFITLTTHNRKADEINSHELRRLTGKEFVIEAKIADEFPDSMYPAEKMLRLKIGAQIMFLKNDTKEKKYFNGKIGVITEVITDKDNEQIKVTFPEINETISVSREKWRNVRYTLNEPDNSIIENELGSFTQFPVRLAWAVTIHKSQGLTFQRAVIDAGAAFAAGQVYVALSRCVSLDGIVLLSPINTNAIATDERIISFTNDQHAIDQLQSLLMEEKELYLLRSTLSLFNMQPALEKMKLFLDSLAARELAEKEKIIALIRESFESLLNLNEVSQKFQSQLQALAANGFSDSMMSQFSERVQKAKDYFEKELDARVLTPLMNVNGDLKKQKKSRQVLKAIKEVMDFFDHFIIRYNPERKRSKQANEHFNSTPEAISATTTDELLTALKQIRREISGKENLAPFMVLHDSTLKEMAMYLPSTINEMALLKGMGNDKLNKYAEAFLNVILSFNKTNGVSSRMELKVANSGNKKTSGNSKPPVKGDSRKETFQLFESGKSISEIAEERNLSEGTIEAHLCFFIKDGTINVLKLLPAEKVSLIKEALNKIEGGLSAVKNFLGEAATYGEIRFVVASMGQNDRAKNVS